MCWGRGTWKITSRNLRGGTHENHEKPVRIADNDETGVNVDLFLYYAVYYLLITQQGRLEETWTQKGLLLQIITPTCKQNLIEGGGCCCLSGLRQTELMNVTF
jgi:hypothetical protein